MNWSVLQVMSKNCACKFLFGCTTAREDIAKVENALETQTELKTELEFYRKNGSFLETRLNISPTRVALGSACSTLNRLLEHAEVRTETICFYTSICSREGIIKCYNKSCQLCLRSEKLCVSIHTYTSTPRFTDSFTQFFGR